MTEPTVSETVRLANSYGLGITLAVINSLALLSLVFWLLHTCHKEKQSLTKLVNETLSTLNNTVSQKLAVINAQTDLIKSLAENMKEANRWNREEHSKIMQLQAEALAKGAR